MTLSQESKSAKQSSLLALLESAIATKYTSGSQITSIASNAARTGKTFKGWYTAPKGGTKVTQSFIVPRPYGDVTFYAQFN